MNSIVDSKKHRGMRNALIIFEHLLCLSRRSWITKLSRNSTQIDSPISRPQKCHSPHIFLENLIFLILTKIFKFKGPVQANRLVGKGWKNEGFCFSHNQIYLIPDPPPPTRLRLHRILITAPYWQSQANFAQLLYVFFSKSRE